MGSCFTQQELRRNTSQQKSNTISSDTSTGDSGFEIEVIPPSEKDSNEYNAKEFAKNPQKFFLPKDVGKCFRKNDMTSSMINRKTLAF